MPGELVGTAAEELLSTNDLKKRRFCRPAFVGGECEPGTKTITKTDAREI